MSTAKIRSLAGQVLELARSKRVMLATVESCTGGLVAGALTEIVGSSDVVERGFVTYSNRAKCELVGVPEALIAAHGSVSAEVAGAMALGGLKAARVGLTVAVTGVAGPGGGTASKPVGLVHFAVASASGRVNRIEKRFGDIGRGQVREKSVETALALLKEMLDADGAQFT